MPLHELFATHELYTDVFASDTDVDQSLRDMLADGALVQVARRSGVHVDLIALNARHNSIVQGVADICDASSPCSSYDQVVERMRHPPEHDNTLRLVVIPDEPLDATASDAAESDAQQATDLAYALDRVLRLLTATPDPSNCYWFQYGGVASKDGRWESTGGVSAIVPKSRLSPITPANVTTLPTLVLAQFSHVDSLDDDLHQHGGVAVTVDEDADGATLRCTCRLMVNGDRYVVTRLMPPNSVPYVSKAFLTNFHPDEWIVRNDPNGHENLAASAEWLASPAPSQIRRACLPAVREVARRRAPMSMTDMPDELAEAIDPITTPPRGRVETPNAMQTPLGGKVHHAEGQASPAAASEEGTPAAHTPLAALARDAERDATSAATPPRVQQETHRESDEGRSKLDVRHVRHVVDAAFGQHSGEQVADTLKNLDDRPYTIVLGADNMVQVLPGALPPQLLEYLSTVTHTTSLPLLSGNSTTLSSKDGTLRIGRVKLDRDVVVEHEQFVVYRAASSSAMASGQSRRPTVQNGADGTSYRGSVPRFARKMQEARSLMHR